MVDLLLEINLQVCLGEKPSPVSNFLTHRTSHIPRTMPQNSALAFVRATTFCFLLFRV